MNKAHAGWEYTLCFLYVILHPDHAKFVNCKVLLTLSVLASIPINGQVKDTDLFVVLYKGKN